jgi:DNA-binding IclR family transcriptional regulator
MDARNAMKQPTPKPPIAKRASGKDLTRGNATLVVGARLLGVVADFNGPMTLTAIARKAAMSPSRAYRYLRGLTDAGLVEQSERTGLYDLGPQVLSLGLKALGRLDPLRIAITALPDLTEATGLVSVLTVWGSHGPTAVRCEHGNIEAPIRIREGIALSLFKTSAGKVFLTYWPAAELQPVLARELAERAQERETEEETAELTERAIGQIKKRVMQQGVAKSLGTQNPMYASLAAPVFDRDGRLQFVISLIGVQKTFDFSTSGTPARILRESAAALSEKLGAVPAKTTKR